MNWKKLLGIEHVDWKETFTPKSTEEIKPGLFIQETKPEVYRVIEPICWEGKYRFRKQFKVKSLITVLIIALVAWSYMTETRYSRQLQIDPCELLPNITTYCFEKNFIRDDDYAKTNNTIIIQNYP